MGKDLKIIKNTVIEPVKQDEQKMNDCFEDIDKAIIKKSIFKDDVYNNIIVMESKSKKNENKEIINEKQIKEKKRKINKLKFLIIAMSKGHLQIKLF